MNTSSIQGEVAAASATLPTGGLALNQTPFDSHEKSSSGIFDGCPKASSPMDVGGTSLRRSGASLLT